MHAPEAVSVVAEVAALLAEFGRLRCVPSVEVHYSEGGLDSGVRLTLVVPGVHADAEPERALEVLELLQSLRRLQDMAQLRALAQRYGIDPAALETLLERKEA